MVKVSEELVHQVLRTLLEYDTRCCERGACVRPKNSPFHVLRLPSISLRDYVIRVITYSACSAECFGIALVYLKRIQANKGPDYISLHSLHRLFITAVLLATKYCDDLYFNNRFYAKVAGVSTSEMNELELDFLAVIRCNLHVERSELENALFCAPSQEHFPIASTTATSESTSASKEELLPTYCSSSSSSSSSSGSSSSSISSSC
mmetsp:Transcript_5/g.23  ORF Transcript_5/g.23 Transcript_5/m.23 type:complete len:206 (+) Transcript_5:199-816(+)